ncbi:protein kinase, partial [candidate division KSB1 bacterium]|nr:protein kinase [candidate division KSB1 bacterium]
MADLVGKTILHYRIIEQVGQGGMGVVYKAEDTKLERTVAIKFLPRQITVNSEERERFKIEAKAAASLNHPNIATIHAIEEVDAEMFIVMEYIEGKELHEIVGARGPVPLPDVVDYAAQIASGLQAAHKKGITHRDIKSANIMITAEDQVKIMDFGLAKMRGGVKFTKVGTTLGTAAYMSPEQARGEEADERADLWSLGVVLYEMLTGKMPFPGDYEQAVMYAIMNEEPEPVSVSRSETPEALQQIVDKSLLKSLQQRYQNIDEMLTNLREVGNHLDTGKTRPSMQTKTSRRPPVLVYGGLAAVVALVVLIGISFFPKQSESIDSIAVLPLDNLSGDTEQDIFTAGMHEALITELSKISALRTISRTSVMRYKETMKSIPEIAKELDVDAVVEGSVLRSGDKVRITVQLIGTDPERHLWAQTFDRDLVDVLALHSEVARQIADEIQIKVTQDEESQLRNAVAVKTEAYENYLLGRHYLRIRLGSENL